MFDSATIKFIFSFFQILQFSPNAVYISFLDQLREKVGLRDKVNGFPDILTNPYMALLSAEVKALLTLPCPEVPFLSVFELLLSRVSGLTQQFLTGLSESLQLTLAEKVNMLIEGASSDQAHIRRPSRDALANVDFSLGLPDQTLARLSTFLLHELTVQLQFKHWTAVFLDKNRSELETNSIEGLRKQFLKQLPLILRQRADNCFSEYPEKQKTDPCLDHQCSPRQFHLIVFLFHFE